MPSFMFLPFAAYGDLRGRMGALDVHLHLHQTEKETLIFKMYEISADHYGSLEKILVNFLGSQC